MFKVIIQVILTVAVDWFERRYRTYRAERLNSAGKNSKDASDLNNEAPTPKT